jgi:ABC-type multidrug transport system ATPase subunit
MHRPHILLLDEPTNSLDPESIDALAKAINEFEGGMVLVSHDMRLISQVAKEIWICDNKTISPYKGDIQSFKLAMRSQMGLEDGNKQAPKALRGDASVKIKDDEESGKVSKKAANVSSSKDKPKLDAVAETSANAVKSVMEPPPKVSSTISNGETKPSQNDDDDATTATTITYSSSVQSVTVQHSEVSSMPENGDNAPPKPSTTTSTAPIAAAASAPAVKGRYIPPHLRKKMMEEQQQQNQPQS